MASDVQHLLGCKPHSSEVAAHVLSLTTRASKPDATTPEIKAYPDAVYFNYYALGISLLYKPVDGYVPKAGTKLEDIQDNMLVLDGVDLYNNPPSEAGANTSRPTKSSYASYAIFPITLNLIAIKGKDRATSFNLTPETTGKEIVAALGEPDRKGGGAGPSAGSINIWCEWTKDGIMIEFGGDESRGPQAWDRGKDAVWKVLSVFPRKVD